MRDQLRQFEGQLVLVTGRLVEKRRAPDGEHINVLITPARVHRWDGVSAVDFDDSDGISVDHLWFRMEPHNATVELLQTCILGGKVGFYARGRDGSIDLGVRAEPLIDLDRLMNTAFDAADDRSVSLLERMKATRETALDALYYLVHQGEKGWAFSRTIGAKEAVREIAQLYRRVDRSIKATEARLATAPNNGRCDRLRQASRLAGGRRVATARGFAA